MNSHLTGIALNTIEQCFLEGIDSDDAYWMTVGALVREGREQGVIDDHLTVEMNAALQTLVKTVFSKGTKS